MENLQSIIQGWYSRTELHSQVLETSKVADRAGDFTREVVAGKIERLKLC